MLIFIRKLNNSDLFYGLTEKKTKVSKCVKIDVLTLIEDMLVKRYVTLVIEC